MNELDKPIPDLSAYLGRLGYKPEDPLPQQSVEALSDLIYRHQCHIPFEDLDIHLLGRTPSLAISDLFDKIVTRRRGGYCFELNGLFTRLLGDLGYRAHSIFCKVLMGRPFDPEGVWPSSTHRACLAELEDGLYFCDVGFGGPMPPLALPVREGAVTDCPGEAFLTRHVRDDWWMLSRRGREDGEWSDLLLFQTLPQCWSDFIPANFFCSQKPDMLFVTTLLASLRTPSGSVRISGLDFSLREGDRIETRKIRSEKEREELLKEYFGIEAKEARP